MTYLDLQKDLEEQGYVASDDLAMALHLAVTLGRPLLLEGAAGVGKTEVARALAAARDTRLIRLQCYEGLDAAQAIYEWNYQRQLLAIQASGKTGKEAEAQIFSEDYLLERPLLQAIRQDIPPVLLIDEIDRADEEFEAYLLEVLADFQITVPELGTLTAKSRPLVILTANGTRDLSDALRRRCLYAHVDYPDRKTELAILDARCPGLSAQLAGQIVGFVQDLRKEDLVKKPGVAEMLDFAAALAGLGVGDLTEDPAALMAALATLLKTEADRGAVPAEVAQRLAGRAA
ncbi:MULTISPECIES: AAA family ATPase [Rhodobacterales]|jgi:MoxR-like ATPase|uniref:AAA family ATPase n=1 Tax=Rhodobacterales TaxID=204455 RepID=UPI00237F560A|nr:MoxR family ATPase [Phaeobacter gallaeciensis]MDE4095983.1 MoxR family ATPase [Phaeobacter gallaeciensis]MDE4104794.1 MoxR family ATPase [Phaeobacter gallaeciensis]MDE4109251.1 MoxR family ATPase [Phaeobacter gallaeciensis]MDE4113718.1 MoxR family ATPase [Phaeobacter gallaeciensis]MDE4118186.1 MoxR family ATPase [Phaeobacter gallaeciensis]